MNNRHVVSKEQFMFRSASKEWNNSCRIVNEYIARWVGFKNVDGHLRFSKLPNRLQKSLSRFAETQLGYEDDWATKQMVKEC